MNSRARKALHDRLRPLYCKAYPGRETAPEKLTEPGARLRSEDGTQGEECACEGHLEEAGRGYLAGRIFAAAAPGTVVVSAPDRGGQLGGSGGARDRRRAARDRRSGRVRAGSVSPRGLVRAGARA